MYEAGYGEVRIATRQRKLYNGLGIFTPANGKSE